MENLLPDFVRSCREKNDVVILHQDAFAADYQEEKYKLLGMAIKFAGLCGRDVRIMERIEERSSSRESTSSRKRPHTETDAGPAQSPVGERRCKLCAERQQIAEVPDHR
jgi:hypothetical protein